MGYVLEFASGPGLSVFEMTPETALDFFKGKGLKPTFHYLDMVREEHDVAFTVAKMLQVDLLNTVRKAVDQAIAEGESIGKFRQRLTPVLQSAGWWGKADVLSPDGRLAVDAQLGSAHRLNTIYRSNLQSAYSVGQWERIQENKDRAPWLLYDAVDDHRTRDEHAKLDNLVRPVDDWFWIQFMPPNGYNCRCGVIQLSDADLERMGIKPSPPPAVQTVPWVNPRTGKVERVPIAVDPGWDHNPGLDRLEHLRKIGREKLQALPADIRPSDRVLLPEREFFNGDSREMQWHRAAFDDSPRALQIAVQGAERISVQQSKKSGAWAQAGRVVEMGSYDTDDAKARGTWRHEFGHILDVQQGNKRLGIPYYSAGEKWRAAMQADAKKMQLAAGKGRRSAALFKRQAERDSEYEVARQAAIHASGSGIESLLQGLADSVSIDYVHFIAAMRRETLIFSDSDKVTDLGASGRARLAEILVAIGRGDPERIVELLLYRDLDHNSFSLKRQAYNHAEALGSLSDLAGATTKNKVAGYGRGFPGHTDSYYRRSPYAQGTEAFANITSLMGHALSFWHEVARRVAPSQVRVWESLIEQQGEE